MYAETVRNKRQVGDSVINYRNVCLHGEKEKFRLEAQSQSREMYAVIVKISRQAGHSVIKNNNIC